MSISEDDPYLVVPVNTMQELGSELADISELIPDINFSGFSAYIMLLGYVCRELGQSLPQSSLSESSWSYIDSVCNIIVGAEKIADPKNEPIANRIRGTINILSGSELIILTTIGLGPIGFAASLGAAFVSSLYATLKTYRRMHDIEYWHLDSQNELAYLKSELLQLEEDLRELRARRADPAVSGRIVEWLITKKERRVSDVSKKCEKISREIDMYTLIPSEFKPDLNAEQAKNLYNNLMLGTAFTGALLLCLPGTQLAGIILITCAIALFCNKHRPKLSKLLGDFQEMVNDYNAQVRSSESEGSEDSEDSGESEGVRSP